MHRVSRQHYQPLEDGDNASRASQRRFGVAHIVAIIQALVILALLAETARTYAWSAKTLPVQTVVYPQLLYSPAQDAIETEATLFHRIGFHGNTTSFQGAPSPGVDELWESLYAFGRMSRISRSEAERLQNETYPMLSNGDRVITLDVFHQLECLNMLRQKMHPEYYNTTTTSFPAYLTPNYCVGHLREAMMCATDISPMAFTWREEGGMVIPRSNILHTCRKFDKIVDWAKERSVSERELDIQ